MYYQVSPAKSIIYTNGQMQFRSPLQPQSSNMRIQNPLLRSSIVNKMKPYTPDPEVEKIIMKYSKESTSTTGSRTSNVNPVTHTSVKQDNRQTFNFDRDRQQDISPSFLEPDVITHRVSKEEQRFQEKAPMSSQNDKNMNIIVLVLMALLALYILKMLYIQ